MIGINISGAEFGGTGGTHDSQYHYPTLAELAFYRDKGVDVVRLPFGWERMQPTLGGALSASELALLKGVLANAASLGMDVIIDLHNYGRYQGQPFGSAGGPTSGQFADFWSKLAAELKSYPSLLGYDLMNEPHDMPSPSAWKDAAQAAVNAIRQVDNENNIYVEGNNWSGAWSWQQYNSDFIINDPAGKLIYQAHQYFDRDSSGTYRGTYDQEGAYANVGVDRLKPFVDWLAANNLKGMIGEFGVPSNDPRWLEVMSNALDYMKSNNLLATAWGGGAWWPSDYSMYMGSPGRADSSYLDLLERYFSPYVETGSTPPPLAPAPTPPPPTGNVITGTPNGEVIVGTQLWDWVYAKEGDDVVVGSTGGDRLDAGAGTDTVDYSGATDAVDVDLTRAEQFGSFAAGDHFISVENFVGTRFHDRISGDELANSLSGSDGDDRLLGRGGGDRLDGGVGYDVASYEGSIGSVIVDLLQSFQQGGDAAGDVLIGIEAVVGSSWDDTLRGTKANDRLEGASGNDLLEGRGGADNLVGGDGVDTVTYALSSGAVDINLYRPSQLGGDAAGDMLSGVENLIGSRFADRLIGNGEANSIDGGAGDDWLNGSWGLDTLTGGAGRDRFLFDSVANADGDRVTDFRAREDRLDFSAIDANPYVVGDQAFTWLGTGSFTQAAGQLRYSADGANIYVAGDTNGDALADFTVTLNGNFSLSGNHFIL